MDELFFEKMVEISKAFANGDEDKASQIIQMCGNDRHEAQVMLQRYYKMFKDPSIYFDLIQEVYIKDGYDFPKKPMIKAKGISKEIPESKRLKGLPEGNPVTIWRGVQDKVSKTDISWTADKRVAIWFANRYKMIGKPYSVYEATIQREKIIAYTDELSEREVLQHMNVENIHKIDIPDDEWNLALSEYIAEKEQKDQN